MAGNIGTPAVSNESELSRAIIEEETNPDPSVAKEAYKSLVQQFDQQRQGAAQAIFRLGECYRRLGRMEEARAQYGRIVREFVDFPDLAQQSMRMLSETAKQTNSPGTRTSDATPDVLPSAADPKFISEMKGLVQEQVRVREQALNRAREQHKAGIAPASEVEEAEVRLLQLKERLLTLMNAEQMASERNQPAARTILAAPASDVLVPRDPKVAQLDTELRSTLAKISELDTEKGKQTQLLEMLKRNNPESLPLSVVNDERYKEMKRAYEEALARTVGASDPKTAEDSVTTAVERIRTWVKQVLIPELDVAAEYRKEQLVELNRRAAELNMRLEKIREEEMVKSPAAARR